MYTLETLIPECVGRYITSSSGSVQLSTLINGRTYAKCWQALVYWIVSQYELGNSTNIAPLGVIARGKTPSSAASASASNAGGPATFHFFTSFLTAHSLKLKSGGEGIREDDLSTIRMNLATLARLADVEPGMFRIALSHLFRRLGEVLQGKEQVLIDFSVGSLIGDKGTIDFLFHHSTSQEEIAKTPGSGSAQQSDPRLLAKSGRWKKQSASTTTGSKTKRTLDATSNIPRVRRVLNESGVEVYVDRNGQVLDEAQAYAQMEEEKEQQSSFSSSGVKHGASTNDYQLARLLDDNTSQSKQNDTSSTLTRVDTLPTAGGFQRKLQGKDPLRNARAILNGTTQVANAITLSPSPPSQAAATSAGLRGRQLRGVGEPNSPPKSGMMNASEEEKSNSSSTAPRRTPSTNKQQPPLNSSLSLGTLPPVLDSFARTQAATYATEGLAASASAKIASFYTPEASAWTIAPASGRLVHTGLMPFVMDRLELTNEEKRMQERGRQSAARNASSSSQQQQSSDPTHLDERGTSKSLLRYQYYLTESMSNTSIAPIKEEWIKNGLALLNTNIDLLTPQQVESLIRDNLTEIKEDYLLSMKKSILDYVLKNTNERVRLGIPVQPSTVPVWGAGDSPSRPPLSWRQPIQRAYKNLSRNLWRNNPAMLSLLEIWTKYENLLLIDLPKPHELPISIKTFAEQQKLHREKVHLIFLNEWSDDLEYVFTKYAKDENLTEDNSGAFFEAVATVCSNQLRSIVERSAEKYWQFFKQYAESPIIQFAQTPVQQVGENGADVTTTDAPSLSQLDPPPKSLITITNSTWIREADPLHPVHHNNPRPIFLQKLLVHKMKDSSLKIEYEITLQEMEKMVYKIYDELVTGLNDLPRVENKIFSVLDETRFIQLNLESSGGGSGSNASAGDAAAASLLSSSSSLPTGVGVDTIYAMRRDIQTIFSKSIQQSYSLLTLYDDYIYLLDEERKISIYLKTQHSLQEYHAQIMKYRAISESLSQNTSRMVRTPIIMCDCSYVNEMLISKSSDISSQILNFLSQRNIDKNIHICDKFKSVSSTLLKKPVNTKELVDLVKYLTKFKKDDRDDLIRECILIKEQLKFMYDLNHSIGTDILSHIGASWSWLLRIDSIIKESENLVNSERNKQEHKIEELRETFTKQLSNYAATAKQFENFGEVKKEKDYETAIHELQRLLQKAEEDIEGLHQQENLLGLTQTDFYQLQQTKAALQPYEQLWSLVANWEKKKYEWIRGPVFKLDASAVEAEVEEMYKLAYKLSQLLSETAPIVAKVAEDMKKSILAFKPHVPLLHILCNQGMRDRHWATVSDIIQFELRPDAHTPLNRVLEMSVEQHLDALNEVSEAASKEAAIEKTVQQMKSEWSDVEITVKKWRETGTYILVSDSIEEIQTLLDDQVVKTQTMRSSPFARPFLEDIQDWEAWLTNTQEIIEVWLKVQSAWVYLQPLMDAEDITRQMPSEGTMFKVVDSNWHKLMSDVLQDTKVYSVSIIPHVLGILKEAQSLLDTIQTGLNQYLETKRLYFPRFYFLSNDELLEILSETKDPLKVQPHLKKCFEGINELSFKDSLDIVAMHSKEGEIVPFTRVINPVDAKGSVERWLKETEVVMRDTIMEQMNRSLKAYTQVSRTEWTGEWPGQVVLTVNQIHWTQGVARAINKGKGGLKEFLDKSNAELQFIVMKVRGDLSYLQRCTLSALVVIDVHARDVVEQLIQQHIHDTSSFEWQSQLRYYWEDNSIKVRMINAQQEYGAEYLGPSERLVITALTDRCYRTLMGALQLNLGGAPEGPAGTGKTETVKDLAKACGIQCVVFNCSDGLDYQAMGKFFKGLASSGAWSCFDEFNRIDLEVLSVVAQQIQTIQRAKELRVESFMFEGTEILLKSRCAVFITMNPGYAGRQALPDNLKAQFRTVAMMIPDYGLIAQILLYSYGFVEAQSLSRKIVATYKLCSEQLSSQDHYDFGMRAVKSILICAQQLLHANIRSNGPKEKETTLLLRSVTSVNLPKFLSHDIELFNGILSDLFPNIKPQVVDYGVLLTAIHDNIQKMNLQPEPGFITKILQLYETLTVRHGTMLVGSTLSGKTTCYRVLSAALSDLSRKQEMSEHHVRQVIINPKSITSGELYGTFDEVSHEWTDGVLAYKFREFANDTSEDRKWLILDGPVDAIWVENLNTVLDDNKKLCLTSGQIIHMTPSMNVLFECSDLSVASPATVSRCGMIYMEANGTLGLGWRCLLLSWLNTLPAGFDEKNRKRLETLFEWLVPPCLRVVRMECLQYVTASDSSLVRNLMNIFDSLLEDSFSDAKKVEEMGIVKCTTLIESLFLFSLVWSVGASVDQEGRKKFDYFLREVCQEVNHYRLSSQFNKKGLVYDYVFSKDASRWIHWSETLQQNYRIPTELPYQEILVPTIDSARYKFLLDTFLAAKKPTLFIGPTGTGKSVYISDTLHSLPREKYDHITIHFSAQTSSKQTQAMIDDKLDRRRRGVYGPTGGKQCVIFVDDLNLPKREKYHAQPPLELLRQYLDSGGWYAVDEFQFHTLVDLQLVAAMGPPGGGRNPVSDRLLRHFISISLTPFEDTTITLIFSSIMKWHFDRFPRFLPAIQALTDKLVVATKEIYGLVTTKLLPTPSKIHYTYNLRDISRVFQGICLSQPDSSYDSANVFMRLWIHEIHRVFCDRLVNDEDQTIFLDGVKSIIKTRFGTDFEKLMNVENEKNNNNEDGTPNEDNTAITSSSSSSNTSTTPPTDISRVRSLFFGDYMSRNGGSRSSISPSAREYIEIRDINALYTTWNSYLEEANVMTSRPMNLVLFRFAIEHLSRIARILKQPGGHALLVGVGGSGKQSLTRLAASVLDYEVMSIELTKSFGKEDWHVFLRKLLRKAGGDSKHTVFLINDTQIRYESFLEDINGLLNSAQVSNLWPSDELAETLELTRAEAKRCKKTLPDGQSALMTYFIQQCRSNLHVVLCMSPIGESFRERLRMFPAILNCCTMNWFTSWPNDALISVASDFLQDIDLDSETRSACVDLCMYIQKDVEMMCTDFYDQLRRRTYVTPTSYLELITTFKTLLGTKRRQIATIRGRYQIGLEKIYHCEKSVKTMQIELENMQPALMRTSQETDEMLLVVMKETEEATKIRESVAKEEKVATEAANMAKAIETECAADLSEAMPILEAAIAALDTLTPQEISEIKAMRNPPRGVKLVMEALCVVKKVGPTRIPDPSGNGKMIIDYWEPSKRFILSDPKLMRSLVEFDKDHMDPKIVKRLREYIAMPDFAIDKIKGVSRAAHSLCSWIYAIEAYDRVVKQVMPKKEALAKSRAEYDVVKRSLDAARNELAKVEGKIHTLNSNLQSMQDEKSELEAKMNQCSVKLERAHTLLSRLGGEKSRWTQIASELGVSYTNLTGDILLSAGVIAYLGPFTAGFRSAALLKWSARCKSGSIPCSEAFSLAKVLGDAVQTRKWVIDGLPNDQVSIDNAVIISHARRWPLMIDPQQQANRWIKNMEQSNKLLVIKANEDYTRALENAIQFGLPVLLENVTEDLDSSLDGILKKHIYRKGASKVLRFNDSDIEWNDSFRFYMTSKNRNPIYLPEIQVKVTLLNFMITPEGLEDQLLSIVVAKEKPDLENERSRLIVTSAANAARLKEIEDRILSVLSSTSGNILDDSSAIEILSASKAISNEIEEKQRISDRTEKEIDTSRMGYKPVAFHAAVLFFCIADLASIDPMYQYSLGWYQRLFHAAIDSAEFSHVLATRISNLNDYFSYSLYTQVCRSLFTQHRSLFSLLLTSRILQSLGRISNEEWRFLLTGGTASSTASAERSFPPNPCNGNASGSGSAAGGNISPNTTQTITGEQVVTSSVISSSSSSSSQSCWLSDRAWIEICRLSTSNIKLRGLHNDFGSLQSEWKLVYDSTEPLKQSFPGKYQALDTFSKLLILRCLRPDKILPSAREFVVEHLGEKFTEAPAVDLATVFAESSTDTPIVFVLSPGADPMSALMKFAADTDFLDKVSSISLGQGQGPIAAKMIDKAIKDGTWVVLQNVHLAPSWMSALEKICDSSMIKPVNAHPDFRLWLTSYPSEFFPVSILQSAIKLTTESPDGMRQNMLDSYSQPPLADEKFFVSCKRSRELKAMTYGLTFFHALIQERKQFGELGWNEKYQWTHADLKFSLVQMRDMLNREDGLLSSGTNQDDSSSSSNNSPSSIPYKALSYMIGEVNYGGRVTDDWDRRTLIALLEQFITPQIHTPNYALSASGAYVVPPDGPHHSYIEAIKALPLTCAPEVFGLHENADITADSTRTNTLFTSLLLTEARSSSSKEQQKMRVLDDLSADILKRLPHRFDIDVIRSKYPQQHSDSMSTVLVQECIRYNKLTDVIRDTLLCLRSSLLGEVVMSQEIELLANSMFDGVIPSLWTNVSYPSLKSLGAYITDLIVRLRFLIDWIDHDIPTLIHLPCFFFPQGFLTGLLQNYARKHKIAIDDVSFDFEFLDPTKLGEKPARPESGAYVKGLYLEGARWDFTNNRLAESHSKVLFTAAPIIWLKPCKIDEIRASATFDAPLYRTTQRRGVLSTTGHSTNFVMSIRLPTGDIAPNHWVQRGVALIASLSE